MIPYTTPPDFLYKYLPFNKKTISSIINQTFWFSSPETFNDPFDCKINFDFNITPEQLEEHLNKTNNYFTDKFKEVKEIEDQKRFLLKLGIRLSQDDFFELVDRIFNKSGAIRSKVSIQNVIDEFKTSQKKVLEKIQKQSLESIRQFRIFCLSATKNNSTMWTHYTDNHKGICIKFEVFKDESFFNFPIKVEYKNKYPIYKYFDEWDNHNAFFVMAGTKSINWKYEKEIRIMKDPTKPEFTNGELYKIKKEAIIEINFGLNAQLEDIQLAIDINEKFYNNKVIILKAIENDRSFNLDFERIIKI